MKKPIIAIKLTAKMYSKLADLGNTVIAGLTGNLSFTTPLPDLTTLGKAVSDTEDAIAKWGTRGNRGSHADLVDLQLKARILADMLKAESQYVQNTAQATAGVDYATMANIIISSGFQLSNARNPQGILQKVQNFHQFVSRKLNYNEVKLKWKKPLNVASAGNVKEYKVLRNTSADINTAVEVAIVTKTTFTDVNTTATVAVWTYWVIAYNTAGAGINSEPVTVAVLGT